MLSRPEGLDDELLIAALQRGWSLATASLSYLAVGAGSHHWSVVDADDVTWFVTLDDFEERRDDPSESDAEVFDRLAAALQTAYALHETGATFVVAPRPSRDGSVLRPVGDRWSVAVFPFVEGEKFRGGSQLPVAQRLEVVEMIGRLHTSTLPADGRPRAEDYRLQNRHELEEAVGAPTDLPHRGPYSSELAVVLREHAGLINAMLVDYDNVVAAVRPTVDRRVPTHGEPHAGNTLRTADGWVLVDWDTARLAPPERDLWLLETGDGVATRAYQAATGNDVRPELLDLFRLRWDLNDLGIDVARLLGPHVAAGDDARAWEGVTQILTRRAAGDPVPQAAWR